MCNCKKNTKQSKQSKNSKACPVKPCQQYFYGVTPFVPGYYSGAGAYGKVEIGCGGYYTGGSSSLSPIGQQTTTGAAAWANTGALTGAVRFSSRWGF